MESSSKYNLLFFCRSCMIFILSLFFRFYRVYGTVNLICCLVQKETGKVQFIHAPCYRYASIYGNNDRYHHEKHSGGIKE